MLRKGSTSIGVSFKKSIDIGAGVIDPDYRGEVGVILFNFGSEDFIVNMGDRIAQLIFEKIKTPMIKEMNELEGTDRGVGGSGSTGMKAVQVENDLNSNTVKDNVNDEQDAEIKRRTKKDAIKNETLLFQSRRLITPR